MGLDAVEVVMAIEEAFDITILDEEASKVRTVGDMKSLIMRKLVLRDKSVCWSQRAFHCLRKAANESFGVDRKGFRPDTLLEEIVPAEQREHQWAQLQSRLGVAAWPELTLPARIERRVLAGLVGSYVVIVGGSAAVGGAWLALLGGAVGVLIVLGIQRLCDWALKPYQTAFPKHCRTVADLVPFVAASDPKLAEMREGKFSEVEVWLRLRKIVSEQLGIKETEIHEHSAFVDDLGLDR